MLAMVSTCAGLTVSTAPTGCRLRQRCPQDRLPAPPGGGAVGERTPVNVTPVKAVAASVTFTQVAPLSVLICANC